MKKFWNLTKAANKNVAELLLYGEISDTTWWGDEVTPKQFSDDLTALGDVSEINVRINSPGGDVFAGMAIHSMLKRHDAQINVYIDGLAASIASIIAMAGDNIIMPKGSMMMIHNPWTSVWGGDANVLRDTADVLDKIREAMIEVYTSQTSLSKDEIIAMLDAETWLTATDAVAKGFAHEVEEQVAISASIRGNFAIINGVAVEWSKFSNAPTLPTAPPTENPVQSELVDIAKVIDRAKKGLPLANADRQILKSHVDTLTPYLVEEEQVKEESISDTADPKEIETSHVDDHKNSLRRKRLALAEKSI